MQCIGKKVEKIASYVIASGHDSIWDLAYYS